MVTVEAHGIDLTSSFKLTAIRGMKITMGETTKQLVKITKHSNCSATTAYLLDSSKSVIASKSFSGDDATFNNTLQASTNYYFAADKGGSSYTERFVGSVTYPYSGTHLDWVAGLLGTIDFSTQAYNIISVELDVPPNTVSSENILNAHIKLIKSDELLNAYIFIGFQDSLVCNARVVFNPKITRVLAETIKTEPARIGGDRIFPTG